MQGIKLHIGEGARIFAYSALGSGTLFMTSIVLARIVSPLEMGAYATASALIGIASITALPGMRTAITVAVARGADGTYAAGTRLMVRRAGFGAAMLGVCALFFSYQKPISLAIAAGTVLFVPMIFGQAYGAYLAGKKQFATQARWGLGATVAGAFFMLLGAEYGKAAWVILTGNMVGGAIVGSTATVLTLRSARNGGASDEKALVFGKKVSIGEMIATCAHHLDTVMIGIMLGTVPAATYFFAKLIPEQFKDIPKIASFIAIPEFARMKSEVLKKSTWTITAGVGTLLACMAGIYAVAARPLFSLLFPDYMAAVPYSIVFGFSTITFMNNIPYHAVQSKLLAKESVMIAGLPGILGLGLMAVLIPAYGIWGAVLAKTGTRIFSLFFSLLVAYRKL